MLSNRIPKLVLTDIDGVWTDGGMFYDSFDNELKKFNTSDSAGVIFCHALDIPVGIITGEDTKMVKRRSDKLKIEFLYQGISDKVAVAEEIKNKLNIKWEDIAYIGDDIGDMKLLSKVGFSATPSNALKYVRDVASISLKTRGGDGAFRAFVEHLLASKMDEIISTNYL